MKNKNIILLIVLIIVLGLGIGIFVSSQGASPEPAAPQEAEQVPNTAQNGEKAPVAKEPTLTIPPLDLSIKEVDSTYFILVNKTGGLLRLTKSKTKVFKRVGEKLEETDVSQVKAGQQVTVNVIQPGVESHLIIER